MQNSAAQNHVKMTLLPSPQLSNRAFQPYLRSSTTVLSTNMYRRHSNPRLYRHSSDCSGSFRSWGVPSFCNGFCGCHQLSRQRHSQRVQKVDHVRVAVLNRVQHHLPPHQPSISLQPSRNLLHHANRLGCLQIEVQISYQLSATRSQHQVVNTGRIIFPLALETHHIFAGMVCFKALRRQAYLSRNDLSSRSSSQAHLCNG